LDGEVLWGGGGVEDNVEEPPSVHRTAQTVEGVVTQHHLNVGETRDVRYHIHRLSWTIYWPPIGKIESPCEFTLVIIEERERERLTSMMAEPAEEFHIRVGNAPKTIEAVVDTQAISDIEAHRHVGKKLGLKCCDSRLDGRSDRISECIFNLSM